MSLSDYDPSKKILPWALLVLISVFYVFELLPSKGITYRDEGWLLYSAWAAVTPGVPLDTRLPQQAAFFFNGALMLLGFENYYAFRLSLHVLLLTSFLIFFTGIYAKDEKPTLIFPLLGALGLFCTRDTLISYNNSPPPIVPVFFRIVLSSFEGGD